MGVSWTLSNFHFSLRTVCKFLSLSFCLSEIKREKREREKREKERKERKERKRERQKERKERNK